MGVKHDVTNSLSEFWIIKVFSLHCDQINRNQHRESGRVPLQMQNGVPQIPQIHKSRFTLNPRRVRQYQFLNHCFILFLFWFASMEHEDMYKSSKQRL